MRRHLVIVLAAVLGLGASGLSAQRVELPIQTPKDRMATTEAGIGSYHITEHTTELHELVEVEAFDVEGELLAECTAEWPEGSKVLTCTMGDGGRFRATWYRRHARFEDLVGGDHFVLRFEGRLGDPNRASADPRERGWVLEGTKTWEEAERDWGSITPVFAYLMAEVEITLGKVLDDVRRERAER